MIYLSLIPAAFAGALVWFGIDRSIRIRKMKEQSFVYLIPEKNKDSGKWFWKLRAPWERYPTKRHFEYEFRNMPDSGNHLFCTWCGHLKDFGTASIGEDAETAKLLVETMQGHVNDMKQLGVV